MPFGSFRYFKVWQFFIPKYLKCQIVVTRWLVIDITWPVGRQSKFFHFFYNASTCVAFATCVNSVLANWRVKPSGLNSIKGRFGHKSPMALKGLSLKLRNKMAIGKVLFTRLLLGVFALNASIICLFNLSILNRVGSRFQIQSNIKAKHSAS